TEEELEELNDKKYSVKIENQKKQWSLDLSNIQHKNNNVCYIFVAVSCVDVKDMMRGKLPDNDDGIFKYLGKLYDKARQQLDDNTSGDKKTAMYRLKLKRISIWGESEKYRLESVAYCFHSGRVSGICRFIEEGPILTKNKSITEKNHTT